MTDKQLELQGVSVHYGDFVAAREVSLALQRGEIGCLLGPSGCGKTTLLRAIAGFEQLSAGEIKLHGHPLSTAGYSVPPEARQVGMVFQDFALFPHLSVERNVAFGLTGMSSAERQQRVADMLQLVGLATLAGRFPHELSGGQQQRVALARALAPGPELLLLDEPFSSLDSQLREQLAAEVRELLKASEVTAILVTHDQQEAFAMADKVALLQAGEVAQVGTPRDLYQQPANEFVARFIGEGAIIAVDANSDPALLQALNAPAPQAGMDPLKVLVRPEALEYSADSPLRPTIISGNFRGAQTLYQLAFSDGQRVGCLAPGDLELGPGDALPVRFRSSGLVTFSG
jgi:iron(III) transport system ATP-binding protein